MPRGRDEREPAQRPDAAKGIVEVARNRQRFGPARGRALDVAEAELSVRHALQVPLETSEVCTCPAERNAFTKEVESGGEVALLDGEKCDLVLDLHRQYAVGGFLQQDERLVVNARRHVHLAARVVDGARPAERVRDELGVPQLARQGEAFAGQGGTGDVVTLPRDHARSEIEGTCARGISGRGALDAIEEQAPRPGLVGELSIG